jgi:hypothetical protein
MFIDMRTMMTLFMSGGGRQDAMKRSARAKRPPRQFAIQLASADPLPILSDTD